MFAGSFDLNAAKQVSDADLDENQSLVKKNLVRQWGSGRLGMLETVHEYARERLDEATDATEVRKRHAAWVAELVGDRFPGFIDEPAAWAEHLDAEQHNIRAALDFLAASGAEDEALGLAAYAGGYFVVRGNAHEALDRIERLLRRFRGSADARVAALVSAAWSAEYSRSTEAATRFAREALAVAGSDRVDPRLFAEALNVQFVHPDRDLRPAYAQRALSAYRKLGEPRGEMQALLNLLDLATDEHDIERARALIADATNLRDRVGSSDFRGALSLQRAKLELAAGDFEAAWEALSDPDVCQRADHAILALAIAANATQKRGDIEDAARLLAATDRLLEKTGIRFHPGDAAILTTTRIAIADGVGADRVDVVRRQADVELDDVPALLATLPPVRGSAE